MKAPSFVCRKCDHPAAAPLVISLESRRVVGVRANDLGQARRLLQMAEQRGVSLHNVAVREFALRGGIFLAPALELYREARGRGAKVRISWAHQLGASAGAVGGREHCLHPARSSHVQLLDCPVPSTSL